MISMRTMSRFGFRIMAPPPANRSGDSDGSVRVSDHANDWEVPEKIFFPCYEDKVHEHGRTLEIPTQPVESLPAKHDSSIPLTGLHGSVNLIPDLYVEQT
jgi:hypothetical protein